MAQKKAHQFRSSLIINANHLPIASSIVSIDHNTLINPQAPLPVAPNQTNNADLVSVLTVIHCTTMDVLVLIHCTTMDIVV